MPSGNFKPEPSRLCLSGCSKLEIGSWKLTEIELGKKKKVNRGIKDKSGGAEKEREI